MSLRLVKYDEYTENLISRFNKFEPYIRSSSCFAAGLKDKDVSFTVEISAADFPSKGSKRDRFIDRLVVDVNNYLYRLYSIPAFRPVVDVKRARNGKKQIKFKYYMLNLNKGL